ncbi:peptide deformylase [Candidatus Poribacteria bacterium]|jgi:peptide deformylase|nr:peptide deformylase [Candidatus Poribacteria bacterium]
MAESPAQKTSTDSLFEAPLRIRIYGEPVLRQTAVPISEITDEDRQLADDMLATMYTRSNGIGLAATQVGILKRLIVIDVNRHDLDSNPLVLINPEIQEKSGDTAMEEGCLSLPDITGEVTRPENVTVTALDLDGEPLRIQATDILSRAIQHEVDHLNGILFIDLIHPLQCKSLQRRLRRLQRESRQFKSENGLN